MAEKISYITPEGLEKLKEELKLLKTVRRRELADRIESAKAMGDLSENAEYHEAKEALGMVEGRIMEIDGILKNYSVIEEGSTSGVVRIGSSVEVEASGKKRTYKIVGSNEADPVSGLISNESPLGEAFLGHSEGDNIDVETPGGTIVYKILKIS